MDLPDHWEGKTIRSLDIRAKYALNVIAVRRGQDVNVSPGADYVLMTHDKLMVLGRDDDIAKICDK